MILSRCCTMLLQAEAMSVKSMQLNADKAAVESNLALKEDEVCHEGSCFPFSANAFVRLRLLDNHACCICFVWDGVLCMSSTSCSMRHHVRSVKRSCSCCVSVVLLMQLLLLPLVPAGKQNEAA